MNESRSVLLYRSGLDAVFMKAGNDVIDFLQYAFFHIDMAFIIYDIEFHPRKDVQPVYDVRDDFEIGKKDRLRRAGHGAGMF